MLHPLPVVCVSAAQTCLPGVRYIDLGLQGKVGAGAGWCSLDSVVAVDGKVAREGKPPTCLVQVFNDPHIPTSRTRTLRHEKVT